MSIKISYKDYRETLAQLNKVYCEAYRGDLKPLAAHLRGLKAQIREDYPEHSDRYTREALGYLSKEVAA